MSQCIFTDSIETNLGLIEELLRGMPPGTRNQAKLAAVTMERAFTSIQKDSQGSPGAALGTAYAVYKLAQRMVEGGKGSHTDSIIQLL